MYRMSRAQLLSLLLMATVSLLMTACQADPNPNTTFQGPSTESGDADGRADSADPTGSGGSAVVSQADPDMEEDDEEGESEDAEGQYEDFDPNDFAKSTTINNEWYPLKPGMRFTWKGTSVDDEGEVEPHTVVFTVTDLVKEIGGVKTVVCWDQDYVDDELVETELAFFAQDDDGALWSL